MDTSGVPELRSTESEQLDPILDSEGLAENKRQHLTIVVIVVVVVTDLPFNLRLKVRPPFVQRISLSLNNPRYLRNPFSRPSRT